ncbi:hypothetical protein [Leifsonia sp. NPDC058230]|uniref:hypothetical protein n=1 Tax=Leifsonia sp. NPDC058230 TaxID=3346391 RepID=UPI0036DBBD69
MKRIHYASGTLVTGDRIADVLVRYAAVLAQRGIAAEVNAPVIVADGSTGSALLLLGPASQMLAEDTPGASELEDPDFVAETERSITALGTPRAGFVKAGTEDTEAIDLDYL